MNNFIWSAVIAVLDLCWLYNFADVILDALHFYANHRANSSKFSFIWWPGVPGLRTWKLKHFMEMTNIEFENDYFKIYLKWLTAVFSSPKRPGVCVMTWLFSLFLNILGQHNVSRRWEEGRKTCKLPRKWMSIRTRPDVSVGKHEEWTFQMNLFKWDFQENLFEIHNCNRLGGEEIMS